MIIEQTIDIPASRRLTLEVPPEIPAGKVILTFTPVQEETDPSESRRFQPPGEFQELPPSYSPEGAIKRSAELRADPHRKPLSDFFGKLSPNTYGDGVAYQRKLRDEWDD